MLLETFYPAGVWVHLSHLCFSKPPWEATCGTALDILKQFLHFLSHEDPTEGPDYTPLRTRLFSQESFSGFVPRPASPKAWDTSKLLAPRPGRTASSSPSDAPTAKLSRSLPPGLPSGSRLSCSTGPVLGRGSTLPHVAWFSRTRLSNGMRLLSSWSQASAHQGKRVKSGCRQSQREASRSQNASYKWMPVANVLIKTPFPN